MVLDRIVRRLHVCHYWQRRLPLLLRLSWFVGDHISLRFSSKKHSPPFPSSCSSSCLQVWVSPRIPPPVFAFDCWHPLSKLIQCYAIKHFNKWLKVISNVNLSPQSTDYLYQTACSTLILTWHVKFIMPLTEYTTTFYPMWINTSHYITIHGLGIPPTL